MPAGFDDMNDIDDLLADLDHELEARFQDLERQADLDEVRAKMARDDQATRHRPAGGRGDHPGAASVEDPLKDLKQAFTRPSAAASPGAAAGPRELLLVLCPACGRKNRLDRRRATTADPRCGACGAALVFTG